MKRILATVVNVLEEHHREAITAEAEKNGFRALFFDSAEQAEPYLAQAEIIFGQESGLARHSPCLRWLCTPSAGVDHLAGEKIFASGDVILSNSSGAYGVTISEHVVMQILEVLRRQKEYSAIAARHEWKRGLPVRSVIGSRITLLGTGDVGKECAVRLRAFGPASLTGVNRGGKNPEGLFDRILPQERIEEALPETDLLVISLPGTPETRHMLDARRLALLPDGAAVVNVGRGTVIDQQALEAELRAGRLYAALDVFEREPLAPDDPLWDCPHLMITPHVAGDMSLPYTRDRIVELFLEDFRRYCAGEPLKRQVDPARGY